MVFAQNLTVMLLLLYFFKTRLFYTPSRVSTHKQANSAFNDIQVKRTFNANKTIFSKAGSEKQMICEDLYWLDLVLTLAKGQLLRRLE